MDYPVRDFDVDTIHFTVAHKPSGAIFRFDGPPDPFAGNEVQVTFPGELDEDDLAELCSAAGAHLNARLYRLRA